MASAWLGMLNDFETLNDAGVHDFGQRRVGKKRALHESTNASDGLDSSRRRAFGAPRGERAARGAAAGGERATEEGARGAEIVESVGCQAGKIPRTHAI